MPGFTCRNFDEFAAHYGNVVAEEVLTRICETGYCPERPEPGVTMLDVHRRNATNHTYEGILEHDGIEFSFLVDNGDSNGTDVRQFTTDDLPRYEPEPPPRYTLVPEDDALKEKRPAMYGVYLAWTREHWFQELLRCYNYDGHFQPGLVIERHYRDKAAARGLKLVPDDSAAALRIQADLAPIVS